MSQRGLGSHRPHGTRARLIIHVQNEGDSKNTNLTSFKILTFIGLCVGNIFAEYNQQDATFLNLFLQDALHVSDGFSSHHQELKPAHTATGIGQTVTATCR